MCQVAIYLNGKEIMRNVTLIETLPEGVRLTVSVEALVVIPAVIRQVDLLKKRVILGSIQKGESGYERNGETARPNPSLDRT
jgi:predicted RNA-binding protein